MKHKLLILVEVLLFGIMVTSSLVMVVSAQEDYPFLFEDGFESGDFRYWQEVRVGRKSTLECVKSNPYDGRYCAKMASSSGASYVYTSVYDYAFVDVACQIKVAHSGTVADNASVFFFSLGALALEDEVGPILLFGWRRVDGENRWAILSRNNETWESTIINGTSPSPNRWYSVYIEYASIVVPGFSRIYVDGLLVHEFEIPTGMDYSYCISSVAIGIVTSSNCKTVRAYFDDFHVSSIGE